MRPHKIPTPLRIALLALPLAIVTVPAASDSDTVRLESRLSRLEDRIAYFDDLLRDVRNRGPVERQFADTDRRLRMMASEIAALRFQIGALESQVAELGDKKKEREAAPARQPAKPDGKR